MVSSMEVVIDTNIYISFVKGEDKSINRLLQYDIIYIPTIVIGELAFGFENSTKKDENLKTLEEFLSQPQIVIIKIDKKIALNYGLIKYDLKTRGKPIPMNDVWIAACATTKHLPLMSLDKHFENVRGLRLD